MADNLTAKANTGSGVEVLATDEIGGVHYPRTKIALGADGVNDGDVSASNPLPVDAVASRLENLVALMARAVKLLESNAIVDIAQRQRIVVDAGTITSVGSVTFPINVGTSAGMDREQYINIAKQTYATSIRSRLNFV